MIHGNARPALCIEHCVTADMADGQSLPPLIEDGVVWHAVHRADGCTIWRRLFLSPSPSASPVTVRRTAPGESNSNTGAARTKQMDMRKYSSGHFIKLDDVRDGPLNEVIDDAKIGKFDKPDLIFESGDRLSLNATNNSVLVRA
jgi:hypothetical protein